MLPFRAIDEQQFFDLLLNRISVAKQQQKQQQWITIRKLHNVCDFVFQ